ncbi:MgtC/SapB family protein [Candidatus Woesearchaeota archaeon]|nr:MgtC/SapB family protein [Candidatus Woesearchaeota archaeon]
MVFLDAFLRLFFVLILSGLFGYNRQKAHKPVGFGTFIFVSVGSCALAITSTELDNPVPLLSAIVTGIGFLGAGAMIKTSDKIFGVTTAASIWFFAIIGLLVGAGSFYISVIVYSFVWVVIIIDDFFKNKGIGSYQRKATIITDLSVSLISLQDILRKSFHRFKLLEYSVDNRSGEVTYLYLVEGYKHSITFFPKLLRQEKGFLKCCVI